MSVPPEEGHGARGRFTVSRGCEDSPSVGRKPSSRLDSGGARAVVSSARPLSVSARGVYALCSARGGAAGWPPYPLSCPGICPSVGDLGGDQPSSWTKGGITSSACPFLTCALCLATSTSFMSVIWKQADLQTPSPSDPSLRTPELQNHGSFSVQWVSSLITARAALPLTTLAIVAPSNSGCS